MSKKLVEAFKLCLPYYKEHIEVAKTLDEPREYLEQHSLDFGICNVSRRIFKIYIYFEDFGIDTIDVAPCPYYLKEKDEIIDSMQARINFMENYISKFES